MEEAAQILEVETLIPMLLQDTDPVDGCRLKRVVLLGDHFQLPPVVKHMALQKFSKLDQSLFTRFIRLGVPSIQLDAQGRARPDIAKLYSWRYTNPLTNTRLGDLPNVTSKPEFIHANVGFAHTFQFVDVPNFQNKGEFSPTPFFYQNLGEAEYVVAVYQYMRLLGYPAEKISIITTYNGQKHLIKDIINQRCKGILFGQPACISTVDKFQGQQNDYILLSMVRTESVGHIRDIRRLVVALSRARLGLYVFGHQQLFQSCYELKGVFDMLLTKPSILQLVANEVYGYTERRADISVVSDSNNDRDQHSSSSTMIIRDVRDVTDMGVIVYQMTQRLQNQ